MPGAASSRCSSGSLAIDLASDDSRPIAGTTWAVTDATGQVITATDDDYDGTDPTPAPATPVVTSLPSTGSGGDSALPWLPLMLATMLAGFARHWVRRAR